MQPNQPSHSDPIPLADNPRKGKNSLIDLSDSHATKQQLTMDSRSRNDRTPKRDNSTKGQGEGNGGGRVS
jgi:hypothetical protein